MGSGPLRENVGPAITERLLLAVLNDPIEADSAEQGLDILATRLGRLRANAGADVPRTLIAAAIADGVRKGLIQEPVRLVEGALHCFWRLELTAHGRAQAPRSQ